MIDPRDLDSTLREARAIAEEAAALVFSGFRTPFDIKKKGEIDLLTEYDLRSEALIRERLEKSFPGTSIVGEEGEKNDRAELVWHVDPIDGTTNYAHGHPYFAVSIALCEKQTPLVGVVVAPALRVTWSGARGRGAFRNDVPCRVSTIDNLRQALCSTGFPYDRHVTEDDNLSEWSAFIKRTVGIRRCGAAAIDISLVADGSYEIFWEQKLNSWDLAAASLFVHEAGGRACDYSGGPLDFGKGRIFASNGVLHDTALAILQKARARFETF
jgi:myo-inositol-1(or 4)-monophosphatase